MFNKNLCKSREAVNAKVNSFCSASFAKKSNSERRVVMGEWSGCDDDTVAQGVDVVYRYTNHCNICRRLAEI